jgi:hypothetical protein
MVMAMFVVEGAVVSRDAWVTEELYLFQQLVGGCATNSRSVIEAFPDAVMESDFAMP